jgi:hypothetical protein
VLNAILVKENLLVDVFPSLGLCHPYKNAGKKLTLRAHRGGQTHGSNEMKFL